MREFSIHVKSFMSLIRIRDSEVTLGTRLRTGPSGVRILVGLRNLSFLQIVQTTSGTHSASCSMVPGFSH